MGLDLVESSNGPLETCDSEVLRFESYHSSGRQAYGVLRLQTGMLAPIVIPFELCRHKRPRMHLRIDSRRHGSFRCA